MKTAYFDAFSGISGDMTVGALIDAGVSLSYLRRELKKIDIGGYGISAKKVKRNSISATAFSVNVTSKQKSRDYARIKKLIEKSGLDAAIKKTSVAIFEKIARAEAKVHGSSIGKVHFHEVGAVDSIVDIVGAAIGFFKLGIKRFECSKIPTGKGFVNTSHGKLPVPAPATLLILKSVPVYGGGADFELTTPTGAAIAATMCEKFGPLPEMKLLATGYGAGKKERRDGVPNLLRLVIGESAISSRRLTVIETNIDDATPEAVSYASERLMESGARDVWVTPVMMKKGRHAFQLSVLCDGNAAERLRALLLEETPSIGVREYQVERFELERKVIKVKTRFGTVRVKCTVTPEGKKRFKPEFDDCREIAIKKKAPFKEVHSAAIEAAARQNP